MKLYKFRPLGDDLSFCRAKEILRTGKFWYSRFWELNDPMEGVYSFTGADGVPIDNMFSGKAEYVICSFSGEDGFKNPAMWGYYANAFKGLAIEIEVPDSKVKKMEWVEDVIQYSDMDESLSTAERVKKILTTKLKQWQPEDEYRFLCRSDDAEAKEIGRITGIHFGDPYGTIENSHDIVGSSHGLRTFRSQRLALREVAEARGIHCYFVTVSKGKVESEPAGAR